jgi:hypothetical protein
VRRWPDAGDPSSRAAISELPEDFLFLFSPIEWQPAQDFFDREVEPVFAG